MENLTRIEILEQLLKSIEKVEDKEIRDDINKYLSLYQNSFSEEINELHIDSIDSDDYNHTCYGVCQ